MVAGTPTLHLSDVIADVKREFGDESGVQIVDSDIARWTNQAQREIISKNPFNKAYATLPTIAGTNAYTLPTDIIQLESINLDDSVLSPVGFDEAQRRLASGTLDFNSWYVWGNTLYLFPVPTEVVTIGIYYVKSPNTVSSPADLLSVPDRYFNAVVQFCMAKAQALNEDSTAEQIKRGLFDKSVNDLSNSDTAQPGAFHIISTSEYENYGFSGADTFMNYIPSVQGSGGWGSQSWGEFIWGA